jgi:MFS family permease
MIMPEMKRDFALSLSGFAWIMETYSVTFTALLLTAGAFADRYGRRKVLLLGNIIFGLATTLLSAPNVPEPLR